MYRKLERILAALLVGLALLGLTTWPLWARTVGAAPDRAAVQVVTLNSTSVATSTTWTGGRWSIQGAENPATKAEVWLFVDETTANTTTFGLQISPDNTTWLPHSTAGTLATDIAADANSFVTLDIQGAYYRVVATATNTNTLTPTIKVVLR